MKRIRNRSKETTCFCDAVKFPHRALTVDDCQWHPTPQKDDREYEREPDPIIRCGHYFIESDGSIGHD